MKGRVQVGLFFVAGLLLFSAITGISSFSADQDKVAVAHDNGVLSRILRGLCGCGLLFVSWCIGKKLLLGWRLFFILQILAWVSFVIGGAMAVNRSYREPSSVWGVIIFSSFLALVTGPIIGYWSWRWYKEKKKFGPGNE